MKRKPKEYRPKEGVVVVCRDGRVGVVKDGGRVRVVWGGGEKYRPEEGRLEARHGCTVRDGVSDLGRVWIRMTWCGVVACREVSPQRRWGSGMS